MLEGAFILIMGMGIGGSIVYFYPRKSTKEEKETPYNKYKNKDGLD